MSSTNVIGFKENEDFEFIKDIHNAHGAAPVIWGEMIERYYLADRHEWVVKNELLNKLWKRWKDLSMPEYHRSVLMMTFDLGVVRREYYERASNDIRKWLDDFKPDDKYVNHWPEIAEIYSSNPDYKAIGIWHTSVSENPFVEWDEERETDEFIGFNEVFDIYKDIDSICD